MKKRARLFAVAACAAMVVTAGCTVNIGGSRVPPAASDASPSVTASGVVTPGAVSATPTPARTTAVPAGWPALVSASRDGVVRLQVVGCNENWVGTGFLVGDREILTAAHVARGAVTISVRSDDGIVRADVVNYDLAADTALLRARTSIAGHHFSLARRAAAEGTDIGVLGYAFGDTSVHLTRGIISDDRVKSVTYDGDDGFTVDSVVATDAAVNGGNSGGPVIDSSGAVVGLVSGQQNWSGDPSAVTPAQGNNFIVPVAVVAAKYASWRSSRGSATAETCGDDPDSAVDPGVNLEVRIESHGADAEDVATALYVHADSINRGLYSAAWSVFTPREQAHFNDDLAGWSAGLDTSYWTRIDVLRLTRSGDTVHAFVNFRTRQDADYGPDNQTCSDWSMDYTMRLIAAVWRIDGTHSLRAPAAC